MHGEANVVSPPDGMGIHLYFRYDPGGVYIECLGGELLARPVIMETGSFRTHRRYDLIRYLGMLRVHAHGLCDLTTRASYRSSRSAPYIRALTSLYTIT